MYMRQITAQLLGCAAPATWLQLDSMGSSLVHVCSENVLPAVVGMIVTGLATGALELAKCLRALEWWF